MTFDDRDRPVLSAAYPRQGAHAAAVGGRNLPAIPGALAGTAWAPVFAIAGAVR
jgi:hypothetical protein